MWNSNVETVTGNIPIPIFAQASTYHGKKKTVRKNIKTKIRNTRTRQASAISTTKYSLLNSKHASLCRGKLFDKDLLLSYRLYEKYYGKIMRKQHLAIGLEEKYKIMYTELQKRVRIDDSPDDVKGVTDINDRFLSYLHVYNEYLPLYKSLEFIYLKRLRTKQEVGYRRDGVMMIEMACRRELEIYETCAQVYTEQVKQFNRFIFDDYEKSMECLKKAETLYCSELVAKVAEVETLASIRFLTQSRLLSIDNIYYLQQKYGRFLYYLSPPSWRVQHRDFARSVEIEAKGFDLGLSSEEDTFNTVFDKMINDCAGGLIKPVLYFSHSSELMTIFETLEQQQLHHFTHVTSLQVVTEKLKKMVKCLKVNIQNDTCVVGNIIGNIEKDINFHEESACLLKVKFMKILYGIFYDGVVATDVLKLQTNLNWCYERIFMEKSNTTIGLTAKALEDLYMKYMYELDAVDNKHIREALKQSIADEKNKMKRARMAARELRLFRRLEKSLQRACAADKVIEADVPHVKRPLTRKPKKQESKTVDRRSNQRLLTDAEIEYLCLFTDWTGKGDPAQYLHTY